MSPAVWLLALVAAIYLAGVFASVFLARKFRTTRWPFKADDKLLRGPGEHLRRQLGEMDEQLIFELMGGFIGILMTLALFLDPFRKLFGWSAPTALTMAVIAELAVMSTSFWRLVRLWRRRADHFLGWFGERVVGEQLQRAAAGGWRVFHDLPFVENGKPFNIDHVAVGPGGVFLIETKTRRKGNARPGFEDNKVYFDGRDLVWPWGEDNHGLEQAERNAIYLANWIKGELGERVHVTPLLALPGWWVEKKPAREARLCQVINPKWLPGLLARQTPVLDARQVEQISLRNEARCRDVED